MQKRIFITLIGSFFYLVIFSQSETQLSKKEIRQLPKIQLKQGEQNYPASRFFSIKNDTVTLFTQLMDQKTGFFYTKEKVDLNNFDHISILDKKGAKQKTILFSAALGVGAFWGVKWLTKARKEDINPFASFDQPRNNGVLEGVIGGTIAASLGMIISPYIFKIKINLNKDKSEAVRLLKKHNLD